VEAVGVNKPKAHVSLYKCVHVPWLAEKPPHLLLQRPISPTGYDVTIGRQLFSVLLDHNVLGKVMFPATGFVEMIASALRRRARPAAACRSCACSA
jgi:hypothetical protein